MPLLVVDESSWQFEGQNEGSVSDSLNDFLSLLGDCRARNEVVEISRALYSTPWVLEVLFGEAHGDVLDRDLRNRVIQALSRLSYWDEQLELEDVPIVVDDEPRGVARSIFFACERMRGGESVGCIIVPSANRRSGKLAVTAEIRMNDSCEVWFIGCEREHVDFFRDACSDALYLELLAGSAFPNVRFVDGVWRGLRDFSKPFQDIRHDVVEILGRLSDSGSYIFGWDVEARRSLAKDHEVQERFTGYTLAPESAYHLKDGEVRRVRTKRFAHVDLLFSWHVKISGDRDRIHIYPPTLESDGKVIVGVFARHLYLRGD